MRADLLTRDIFFFQPLLLWILPIFRSTPHPITERPRVLLWIFCYFAPTTSHLFFNFNFNFLRRGLHQSAIITSYRTGNLLIVESEASLVYLDATRYELLTFCEKRRLNPQIQNKTESGLLESH